MKKGRGAARRDLSVVPFLILRVKQQGRTSVLYGVTEQFSR
jgi:hypothetical protein